MKLVLFIQSLGRGGAERVATSLASHWAGRGWEVRLVTLAGGEDDAYPLHPAVQRVTLHGAAESRGLFRLVANLRRVRCLRKELTRDPPEVAVAIMVEANVILALSCLGLRSVARVGTEHTHPPQVPLGPSREWLRRLTYGWLDAVVSLTSESRDWLLGHTGARRVVVIPNAVTWPMPSVPSNPRPEDVGSAERHRAMAVGRLIEVKQFGLLIEIFAGLADRFPDWELVILGEGPERARLEARVRELRVEGQVLLPGHTGNVSEWYARAEICVLSSRFEGFPNVLLEALAHGVPVVSVDCDTGPRDIVRPGVDGILVPVDDVPAFTAALARLMGDPDLRRRFSARAVEVRDRFSIDRVSGLWDELLQSVRR